MKIRKRRWHLFTMRQRPPDSIVIIFNKFLPTNRFYDWKVITTCFFIFLTFENMLVLPTYAVILSGAPDSFARFIHFYLIIKR